MRASGGAGEGGKGLQDQVNALQKRLEDSEHLLEKAESDFKESQEKGKNKQVKDGVDSDEGEKTLAKLKSDLQSVSAERDALRAAAEFNTRSEKILGTN